MGQAWSENVVNQNVSILMNVMINVLQDCSTVGVANQTIIIDGCHDADFTGINQRQYVYVDGTCLMSASSQIKIDTDMKTAVEQVAKAINTALSLNPGSTRARNITDLVTKLSFAIKQSFLQNCAANLTAIQGFFCKNSTGIRVKWVKQKQVINVTRNCTMNTAIVTDIKTRLVTEVKQTAIAEVKGLLDGLLQMLLIILIILGAVVFLGLQGFNKALDPTVLAGIALLILMVLVVNYALGWFPFRKTSTSNSLERNKEISKRNNTILAFVIGLIVVDVAFLVFWRWFLHGSSSAGSASASASAGASASKARPRKAVGTSTLLSLTPAGRVAKVVSAAAGGGKSRK